MKKRTTILTLAIIALLAIGLNITGFSVGDPEEPSVNVTRLITKNQTEDFTEVRLGIVSTENVLAIQEVFIPADCAILDTYAEPEIDILEVNELEQTWVIANRSENLNIDVYYFLPYDCDVDENAGEVLILTDDDLLASSAFDQDGTADDPEGTTEGTGGTTTGGSGITTTTTTTTQGVQSTPITQAETQEEFDGIVKAAAKNLLGLDESKRLNLGSFTTIIILIVVVLVIILFVAYSFLKRPRQFQQQAPKQGNKQI
jgi:hypothetical protein